MKKEKLKPGEAIAAFLDFLEMTKREYESVYVAVGPEAGKAQTFWYDLEFVPVMRQCLRFTETVQR